MKVFIYGTLKRKRKNHCFLKALAAKFLKEAETKPKFLLIVNKNTNIPYLLEGGNVSVKGEVYEIDEKFIPALDAFESSYSRKKIRLVGKEKAWCYLAPFEILHNGVF
jgi:gamma-glutamylcyclotransferase (GGCT)/AIG2-like uncharacterized protein YtfP